MNASGRPRISIVMSVHNGARYLEEAVDSICAQTFRDFEFLIVNDGSADASDEILARHARGDHRIRVLNQQHSGLVESLNRGFNEATGEFIARMDADDLAKPERLDRQIRYMDANPAIALVGSAVETIDTASRARCTLSAPSDPHAVRTYMRTHGCAIFHPTVMVRRNALEECGGFRKAYRHAEDYDLWLRMLERFDLANLDEVLLGYRRHKKTVSFTNVRQQAVSALCARRMAELRSCGAIDRTAELELITDATLAELGVSRSEIDEAIFRHMIAVTVDLIQSGISSAAAEFPELARDYATPARVKGVAMNLNRAALRTAVDPSERRAQRTRLLATSPELYWELFGSNVAHYSIDRHDLTSTSEQMRFGAGGSLVMMNRK